MWLLDRFGCLDWTPTRNRQRIHRALDRCLEHHNTGPPARGIGLEVPGRQNGRGRRLERQTTQRPARLMTALQRRRPQAAGRAATIHARCALRVGPPCHSTATPRSYHGGKSNWKAKSIKRATGWSDCPTTIRVSAQSAPSP